jgi:hypothetical protein
MTKFKFTHKRVWIAQSSGCVSQHAMVIPYSICYRTNGMHLGGPILQTFDVVKHYPWVFHNSYNMHMLNKMHTMKREDGIIIYKRTSHSSNIKALKTCSSEITSWSWFDIGINLKQPEISILEIIWDESEENL